MAMWRPDSSPANPVIPGKISFRNLKRVARELGENMTDEELQEMINKVRHRLSKKHKAETLTTRRVNLVQPTLPPKTPDRASSWFRMGG